MKFENKKLLPSKIAKYSLMAGAALSLLNSCKKDEEEEDNDNPNIEVRDINPDVSLTAPLSSDLSQNFDINGDGINDVFVNIGNTSYSYYGYPPTNINVSYFGGLNGSKILTEELTVDLGGYNYTFDAVTPISAGNVIGASQVTWMDTSYLGLAGVYNGINVNVGSFLGQDKYVGVSIQVAGNTHYAWLQMSFSANGSNVVVKKMAYHTTPNTAINAGEE